MEASITSKVCSTIRSCWTPARRGYKKLPPRTPRRPAPARGVRLRLRSRLRSPLHLLSRAVDAYINSILSPPPPPLRRLAPALCIRGGGAPPELGRAASRSGCAESVRRGVVLNFCVAEVLLRRSSSEVRRSPLRRHESVARSAKSL